MAGETEQGSALRYRPALDGLRAIAVGAVVAYHLDGRGLRGGFLGVDTFFVLSGFLITTLLLLELERTRRVALVAFWGRRLRRLLPALLGVLAAVALFAWWIAPTMQRATLRGDALAGLLYVANWRFVASGQSYFDLYSAPSPLRHLWSLAIEEQFYLVWPIVVLAAAGVGRRLVRIRVIVGAIAAFGAVASIWVMARLYDGSDPSRAYYGTDARVHTILIGCLLAVIVVHWRPRGRVGAAVVQGTGIVAFVGVLAAYATVSDRGPWLYRGGSALFALAVAAVVLAAAQDAGPLVRALGVAPARALGRISYGVYLWHWPVIVWLTPTNTHLDGAALTGLRLAVTLAAATVSYHVLEMPIRRASFAGWRAAVAVPAVVGVTVVALVLGTAGATVRPNYLGGGGALSFAMPCPEPSASETAAAADAAAASTVRLGRGAPRRVLVLGDSVACSLRVGLEATRPGSVVFADGSVIGCGVVAGRVVSESMRTPRYQRRCERYAAASVRSGVRALGGAPDAVVLLSTWERFDLVVGGRTLRAGTKDWETELTRRLDRRVTTLRRLGARVYVALPAPSTEGRFGAARLRSNRALDLAMLRLGDFLTRYAAGRSDDVSTLDLAGLVCPGGPPCPPVVGGQRLRPFDGTHFDPAGAVRVAAWMWDHVGRSVGEPSGERAER
ncbi:MAG: acyltransferase family protein [Actinomycetes bacterium]